jgi:hypothetical protein
MAVTTLHGTHHKLIKLKAIYLAKKKKTAMGCTVRYIKLLTLQNAFSISLCKAEFYMQKKNSPF